MEDTTRGASRPVMPIRSRCLFRLLALVVGVGVVGACSDSSPAGSGDATADARIVDAAVADLVAADVTEGVGDDTPDAWPEDGGQRPDTRWGMATLIGSPEVESLQPSVVVDTRNEVTVLWSEMLAGVVRGIFAKRYGPSGWGLAVPVSHGAAAVPQVGLDSGDNLIAIFEKGGISTNRTIGENWGVPTLIPGPATGSRLAVAGNGTVFVAWSQIANPRGEQADVSVVRRAVGASNWDAPTAIETTETNAFGHEIVADANGNAILLWLQFEGFAATLWANRYSEGTGWEKSTALDPEIYGGQYYPSIAMDNKTGNALVVWQGPGKQVWSSRYVPGRGWEAKMSLGRSVRPAVVASVSMDAQGNAMATWAQSEGGRDNIWARRYVASMGWEPATLIEHDDSREAQYPQVAVGPHGEAIAVWRVSNGTNGRPWANYYLPGIGWGTAGPIDGANELLYGNPVAVVDSLGNATVIWVQQDVFQGRLRFETWANRLLPAR